MSDYRTKIGRVRCLKRFDSKEDFNENIESWSKNYLISILNIDPEKSNLEPSNLLYDYFESTDREMIVVNNSVWLITNSENIEDKDSYCYLTKTNNEDEYEFRTRFYDGGTCEGEVIRDVIKNLEL